MNLRTELGKYFGHADFRPGQERVIAALLEGRSAFAMFPTGGGKSICYQLPAVLLEGLTVVVSPLIALMKDQVDTLRARGIAAARLDSTLEPGEALEVLRAMEAGELKMLYLAPERLSSEALVERLRRRPPVLLAIDESHCISEWGHNFRPEYLRLAALARRLRVPRVLALTATATKEVVREICREFRIAAADRVITSFHRPNLALHITPVKAEERLEILTGKLTGERRFPAIVYVTRQETAETVAGHLVRAGIPARVYHAGLADEVRAAVQEEFMAGRVPVIVATIAFGMGIDKADIRAVYHFNLPKTLENYQQETGRAGRDGEPAHCEMLACGDDLLVLQNFTLGDTPGTPALQQVVDYLLRQGPEMEVSLYELSRALDVRPLVLETVITYLEKERLLEPVGVVHATLQIAFGHSLESVLAGHDPVRRRFLGKLFGSGKMGRRWLTLDMAEASRVTGADRGKILRAVGWLEEAGDIEIRRTGTRHCYRLRPGAGERRPAELAVWLAGLFAAREQRDLERLGEVVELALHPGCTTRRLLAWFGEKLSQDCGHCGRCLTAGRGGKRMRALPARPPREISIGDLEVIRVLRAENRAALRSARQLTRFLCGLSSPATLRDRLTRHEAFGLLAEVPFQTVLAHMETLAG